MSARVTLRRTLYAGDVSGLSSTRHSYSVRDPVVGDHQEESVLCPWGLGLRPSLVRGPSSVLRPRSFVRKPLPRTSGPRTAGRTKDRRTDQGLQDGPRPKNEGPRTRTRPPTRRTDASGDRHGGTPSAARRALTSVRTADARIRGGGRSVQRRPSRGAVPVQRGPARSQPAWYRRPQAD